MKTRWEKKRPKEGATSSFKCICICLKQTNHVKYTAEERGEIKAKKQKNGREKGEGGRNLEHKQHRAHANEESENQYWTTNQLGGGGGCGAGPEYILVVAWWSFSKCSDRRHPVRDNCRYMTLESTW